MGQNTITIDHTKVGASLANFPIYINLGDIKSDITLAEAQSIRVYKADGVTELPREIVSKDEMHFKADSLSSTVDTVFKVDIDGIRTDYDVTDTYGRNAVWTNGYAGVWHMGELDDSTGISPAGTNSGTTIVDGTIGKARQYDVSDYIRTSPIGSGASFASNFTISGWVTFDSLPTFARLFTRGPINGEITVVSGNGHTGLWLRTSGTTDNFRDATPTTPLGVPTRFDFTYNHTGNSVRYYKDGSLSNSADKSLNPISSSSNEIYLVNNQAGLDGVLDEVRLSSVIRSASWVSTEYNNQSSPATFYSVEGEQ